ncbi:MAG: hypothetical protein GY869_19815 [Planctomycetes bacterium]|nr:hypothetical protein [Planctomycetota bacterium]
MKRLFKWFGIGMGVFVLFVFVKVLWFVYGKPTVSVNYVEQLNDLVRPVGAVDDENACTLFIEATDLLQIPNDIVYDLIFGLTYISKYHHQFSDFPEEDQEKVNQWVERYYVAEPDYYAELIDDAKYNLPPQDLPELPTEGGPENRVFLDDVFLRIFFPGYELGSEYYGEYLFGFGWDMSHQIIDDNYPARWNKAIAALMIKEWQKQIMFEKQEVPKWLALYESAWRKLEEGCERDYFWYEYDESGAMRDAVGSNLGALRAMIKMGVLKARLALDEGKAEEALDIYVTMFRVCRLMMEPHNDSTTSIVAPVLLGYAAENMLDSLSSGNFDAATLEQVQKEMEGIFEGDYPYIKVEAARLRFLDIVQRTFTDGGIGGGHLIHGALEAAVDTEPGTLFDFTYTFGFFECWNHAGRNKTIAEANRLYDHFNSISEMNLYERHLKKLYTKDMLASLPVEKYMLVHMYLNYINRDCVLDYRGKAKFEAVVTVLALRRWELERGEYPEGLAELVEGGYLAVLPDDPYSPGEFRYERRGDDFILYSWGGDFDDDGGVYDRDWDWGEGEAGGDYVFWPIRKLF